MRVNESEMGEPLGTGAAYLYPLHSTFTRMLPVIRSPLSLLLIAPAVAAAASLLLQCDMCDILCRERGVASHRPVAGETGKWRGEERKEKWSECENAGKNWTAATQQPTMTSMLPTPLLTPVCSLNENCVLRKRRRRSRTGVNKYAPHRPAD